jgi:hypothetical protein
MTAGALGEYEMNESLGSPKHEPLAELESEWEGIGSCNSAEALYSNPQAPSQHKGIGHVAHNQGTNAVHATANPAAEESATRVSCMCHACSVSFCEYFKSVCFLKAAKKKYNDER